MFDQRGAAMVLAYLCRQVHLMSSVATLLTIAEELPTKGPNTRNLETIPELLYGLFKTGTIVYAVAYESLTGTPVYLALPKESIEYITVLLLDVVLVRPWESKHIQYIYNLKTQTHRHVFAENLQAKRFLGSVPITKVGGVALG